MFIICFVVVCLMLVNASVVSISYFLLFVCLYIVPICFGALRAPGPIYV